MLLVIDFQDNDSRIDVLAFLPSMFFSTCNKRSVNNNIATVDTSQQNSDNNNRLSEK
jgi:hypothetical protein